MRQALQNAAESFGENDKRTQNWQVQLNNAEAALNDMEREVENNEKAIDSMGEEMDDSSGDAKELGESVEDTGEKADDAGGKFEKFKSVISTAGKITAAAVTAIAAAATAAGKALWDMANQTAEYGDEIEKNSQKVGLSFESYQKWDYAMKICGTEMSSCKTGLKTLTNTFDDAVNGSSSATEKFNRLGLSMEDLKGLSREDLFATVVRQLQSLCHYRTAGKFIGKSGFVHSKEHSHDFRGILSDRGRSELLFIQIVLLGFDRYPRIFREEQFRADTQSIRHQLRRAHYAGAVDGRLCIFLRF